MENTPEGDSSTPHSVRFQWGSDELERQRLKLPRAPHSSSLHILRHRSSHPCHRLISTICTKRVFSFASSRGRHVGDAAGAKGAVVVLVLAVQAQGHKAPPRTLFTFPWVAALASLFVWQRNTINGFLMLGGVPVQPSSKLRPMVFCLTEFGGWCSDAVAA
ncbi:hypothetical protein V8G54_011779 [Vigna mungo]|uniref:Uncharacterized protein n=1 Tax=Vigna mungo TaxID=3915 RepID=A0AAQ3NTI3_VIGMU